MNWIRIATGIMDDPSVLQLAEAAGVSVPTTTGHVVGVLAKLPTHAKTGDLSGVSDRAIEQWAKWPGKQGKFATAFRTYLCNAQGVVSAWEKHNGAAIREADRRAETMRQRRANRVQEGHVTGNAGVTVTVTPALTGRDGTGRTTNNNKPLSRRAVAAGPAAKFPHFGTTLCQQAYDVWLAEVGSTSFGVFRNAFGPLFQRPEGERPATLPRDAELIPAIKLYLAAVAGTPEARFTTPQKCAGSLTRVLEALREGKDSDARLSGAQWAIGTAQRPLFKVPA